MYDLDDYRLGTMREQEDIMGLVDIPQRNMKCVIALTPETWSEKMKLHSHYIWVNRWHLGKWLCSSQIEMANSTYNI